jgi:hypothetical protein
MAQPRKGKRTPRGSPRQESLGQKLRNFLWGTPKRIVGSILAGIVAVATFLGAIGGALPVVDRISAKVKGPPPVVSVAVSSPTTVDAGENSLRFATNTKDFFGPAGFSYIVPRPIQLIGRPPSDKPSGWRGWAYAMGGVDGPATIIRVTLQGEAAEPVLVESMRIRIVKRGPRMRGTVVKGADAGCGELEPTTVLFRLESPHEPEPPPPGYKGLPYSLQKGEFGVFDVIAAAGRAMYEWVLEVHLISGGREKTVTIDDGDNPFRTSAVASDPGPRAGLEGPYRTDVAALPQYAWEPPPGQPGGAPSWKRSRPPC